ncbi:hypothetical protein LINPERPRIM_LOCUS26525, partial [Linum perenne]
SLLPKKKLRSAAAQRCVKIRRRGPIVVTTVAGTVMLVLMSTVYTIGNIQKRWIEEGGIVNPTEQVLMATHLIEATLMGKLHILLLQFPLVNGLIDE